LNSFLFGQNRQYSQAIRRWVQVLMPIAFMVEQKTDIFDNVPPDQLVPQKKIPEIDKTAPSKRK
jgi:hypothetical protein